jgi:V-type H+-transporting ATPase subunit C
VSHKIWRQIEDLERAGGVESGALTVDGVLVDTYLTRSAATYYALQPDRRSGSYVWMFCPTCSSKHVWGYACRYPTMSPLKEIIGSIQSQVAKIEDDMKVCFSCTVMHICF